MVNSLSDLRGFDYLVSFKDQKDGSKITPSIIKGAILSVECPILYRDFIETKVYNLRRAEINQKYNRHILTI
jgi:hypothetical protein